ncbi:uncharacterized protein EV420DRAFT_1474668 [Desarmillaria tabescens]|uniref:Uncharacterized protein n=1 Tax=Armillaria tabescens TaxID=1929756 RepID=A0AA39NKL1_ARMTA|nr:uncharacterized protein EV420DRAFT_1474668 [Desarmillaria tabescens]KAK0467350.1 hypothetical protein EV420DRAFT_1474668 [Desarmillaria tabescens]
MMKAFLDDEIGEDISEVYVDYFEEDVDIAYLDEESEDNCTQLYAAAQENEAVSQVRNQQAVPKRPPENVYQQIRGLPVKPTKAVTTNPYGTRMNPNKNIISDNPGIHEQNVQQESLSPLNPIVPVDACPTCMHNLPETEDIDMSYKMSPAVIGQNPGLTQNDELAARQKLAQQPLITRRNQETLLRQFNNVYLRQANIVTNVVFFVGNYNVIFQLLLGQPWICRNLVSMDERVEGTYLIYGNPKQPKDYMELFVVDEQWDAGLKKTAIAYFAGARDMVFEGAWKINNGEKFIELGPPVTYLSCLAQIEA